MNVTIPAVKWPEKDLETVFKADKAVQVFYSQEHLWDEITQDNSPVSWCAPSEGRLFVAVKDLPPVRYDTASGTWQTNGFGPATYYYQIDHEHVLYELGRCGRATSDEGHDTIDSAAFPVLALSGFVAFKEYLELLRKTPADRQGDTRLVKTTVSSIIEEIYLPFYSDYLSFNADERYDAWTPAHVVAQCWLSLNQASELVKQHRARKSPWLNAVRMKAYERESDEKVDFDACESLRLKLIAEVAPIPDVDSEYLLIHLFGSAQAISYPTRFTNWGFTGDWESLPLILKVSSKHSASFLAGLLESKNGVEIRDAVRKCLDSGSHNPLKSASTNLPPRVQQIRLWVSRAIERQELTRASEWLVNRRGESKMTWEQQDQVTRVRLTLVNKLLRRPHGEIGELERVMNPLPYFFEYPILQWERSNDKMAFTSAVSLFHLVNKISCLIAFEEVLAAGNGSGLKTLLGDDLVRQLSGKPSLGSWSKALEVVEKNSSNFHVWKRWFETLATEREDRIRLISVRNEISHPDSILEESELDEAKEEFATYFYRLVPKLRKAYSGIATVITHGRKIIRTENGATKTLLDCEKLDALVEPFPRISLEMESSAAANLSDECLTSFREGSSIELRRFFQLRSIKSSVREIFLYEREYSGRDAVWAGLTTAQSGKLETSARLFD